MKTVLFPYNGSNHSEDAIPFLLSLLASGDKVIILHCMNKEKMSAKGITLESLEEKLQQVSKLFTAHHVVTEIVVVEGVPSIEIAKAARVSKVDFIAMGSRAMGPVVGKALGSITSAVLHITPCPVLVIPHKE